MGVEGKQKAEVPTAGTVEIMSLHRDMTVTVKLIRTTEVDGANIKLIRT